MNDIVSGDRGKATAAVVLALVVCAALWVTSIRQTHAAASEATGACLLQNGASMAQLKAAVQAACAEIATAEGASVRLEGAGEVVVPANTRLAFRRGASWTLQDGVVVRLLGTYDIPLERRAIFSGPGRIVAEVSALGMDTCKRAASVAYPEWFGAAANDQRSDSDAIMRAADLGRDIQLQAGTYVLSGPVWLRGGQRLSGAGQNATVLKQTSDFEIQKLSDSIANKRPSLDIKYNNFAVGLDSDCAEASALAIDGSAVSNEALLALADTPAKRERKEYFPGTYVHGIKVATDYWFYEELGASKKAGTPFKIPRAIRNVKVSNVSIRSPAISCIYLQSAIGVKGLLIDHVDCDAREAWNSSGFNAELWHPDRRFANINEDVTIQDSRFVGGRYAVVRSAGIKNLKIFRSTFDAKPTTQFTASFYTSDSSGPLSAEVYNATFRHTRPANPGSGPVGQKQALGVIEIVARGINNRPDAPNFMAVPEGGTSLKFYDTTIGAPKLGQVPQTIPLVVVRVGTSMPTEFHRSTFIGGTYALVADPQETLVLVNVNGINQLLPLTPAQRTQYRITAVVNIDKCKFEEQTEGAIRAQGAELHVNDSSFLRIGTNKTKPQPIIQFGQPKPDSTDTDSSFIGNTYSAANATAFIGSIGNSRGTRVQGNHAAADAAGAASLPVVGGAPSGLGWLIN